MFLLISQSNSSPAPNDKMKEILMKTVDAAKALISKVRLADSVWDPHWNCPLQFYVCANPPSEASSS